MRDPGWRETAFADRVLNPAERPAAAPVARLRAIQFSCPERLDAAGVADQAPRYQQPQKRPDETQLDVSNIDQHGDSDPDPGQHGDRRRREAPGRPPRPGAQGLRGGVPGTGLGGGKICQEIPELTPGPRGRGPPRPPRRTPRTSACPRSARPVRHDRITVGIGSLHLSRKIIPRHGVHRAPAFLTRTIVSGFRMYLMSSTRVIGTIAGCRGRLGWSICHGPSG